MCPSALQGLIGEDPESVIVLEPSTGTKRGTIEKVQSAERAGYIPQDWRLRLYGRSEVRVFILSDRLLLIHFERR